MKRVTLDEAYAGIVGTEDEARRLRWVFEKWLMLYPRIWRHNDEGAELHWQDFHGKYIDMWNLWDGA